MSDAFQERMRDGAFFPFYEPAPGGEESHLEFTARNARNHAAARAALAHFRTELLRHLGITNEQLAAHLWDASQGDARTFQERYESFIAYAAQAQAIIDAYTQGGNRW